MMNSNEPLQIALELDARNLKCPHPILKAKRALASLASGQLLKVMATDPSSASDFAAYANQTGNTLVCSSKNNNEYLFILRRK